MTVPHVLFYALVWAFLLSALLAWFWFSKLNDRVNEVDTLKRVIKINIDYHARTVKFCYDEICNRANLRHKDLPPATHAIYERVRVMFFLNNTELNPYHFPLDALPFAWNLQKEEMPPAVLAHLWLKGII